MASEFYQKLGIPTIINAAATFTDIGGSLMPPEVLDAMAAAAAANVDMHELHLAVGKRLAKLTKNESAYVTSGCAAGIALAVLGIRTGGDPRILPSLPGHDIAPFEVIMHAAHRIPYDRAVALAGGVIRQVGDTLQTLPWELEAAFGPSTAAVLYVAGTHLPQSALPLETVVPIAHGHGVPVIVDAAAQLPPVSNLWKFTRDAGADLALFSGGKALRGPQTSGLMVGKSELVEAARQNAAPFQRWGRAFKIGKEEIAGLLTAVERFVSLDHAGMRANWREDVVRWHAGLQGFGGVDVTIEESNEAGQPVPRLHVGIRDTNRAKAVLELFRNGTPRLAVYPDAPLGQPHGFWITPDLTASENIAVILDTVRTALSRTSD